MPVRDKWEKLQLRPGGATCESSLPRAKATQPQGMDRSAGNIDRQSSDQNELEVRRPSIARTTE